MRRALIALLIVGASCGGGTEGTPVAPPTAPTPTPPPAPEPTPPPPPPIEITPVDRGISVTDRGQILVELTPGDIVPANPLDLAGRTLVFTPDGRGSYSRSVRALAWEDDIGNPVDDNEEIEPNFRFDFAGQKWESFFVSRDGLVTFGEPYPFPQVGPDRWGTMQEIAGHLGTPPLIAALYKPRLGGSTEGAAHHFRNTQHVARSPDRIVITWITSDPPFHVHGVPPQEKTRFQMALHADGRIALHYAPEPKDPDEAIRDGIVGLFPGTTKTGLLGSIPDPIDGHLPGYLDLVETAIYTMAADPTLVLVEFTTRGPIRPIPDHELIYHIVIDTDEPDDRELRAGVSVSPDGERGGLGVARIGGGRTVGRQPDRRSDRRAQTLPLGTPGIFCCQHRGGRVIVTGEWGESGDESSPPAAIRFPDVAASPPNRPVASRGPRRRQRGSVPLHLGVKESPVLPIGCRVIETLGDEFDAFVFHSQFRYDIQFSGSWWSHYPGNVPIQGLGRTEGQLRRKSPCGRRMRGQWGFPIWTKSDFVAVPDGSGGYAVGPPRAVARGPRVHPHLGR